MTNSPQGGYSVTDYLNAIRDYASFGEGYYLSVVDQLLTLGYVTGGWNYQVGEHHIYGSSRIGVHQTNTLMRTRYSSGDISITLEDPEFTTMYRGKRHYELSNHLGNVQVVITDKRVSKCDSELAIEYFEAEVLTAMDYYPFGMMMPDRQYYANSDSSNYRFGFNGKEIDREHGGAGNVYDYGFRIYNPALGKFLSVDPLTKSYPWYTPYQFAGNMPICAIDLDGLEEYIVIYSFNVSNGKTHLMIEVTYIKSEDRKESHEGTNDQNRKADIVTKVNDVQKNIHRIPENGTFNRYSFEGYLDNCSEGQSFGFLVYKTEKDRASFINGKVLPLKEATGKISPDGKLLKATTTELDFPPISIGYETSSSTPLITSDIRSDLMLKMRYMLSQQNATATVTGYVSLTTSNPDKLSQERADAIKGELLIIAKKMGASPDELKSLDARITPVAGGTGLAKQNKSPEGSNLAKDRQTIVTVSPNP